MLSETSLSGSIKSTTGLTTSSVFSIHDYFFAKALDQVRPGGVIAFVTSRYTMISSRRRLGSILPSERSFSAQFVCPTILSKQTPERKSSRISFSLQKRDRPIEVDADWIHLGKSDNGYDINSYFVENPEMVLGYTTAESTQYGRQDYTVAPIEGLSLATQLAYAVSNIRGTYAEAELPELGEGEEIDTSIPADPNVKNYSYTVIDNDVYYRENSRMVKPDLNATAKERVKGMVELRDCVQKLIFQQMDSFTPDMEIRRTQTELNDLYDSFTDKYGLINSRGNASPLPTTAHIICFAPSKCWTKKTTSRARRICSPSARQAP